MKILLIIALIFIIVNVITFLAPMDSTDKSKWGRSGLIVYTDNATWVQYLKAGLFGAATPRLNNDGTLYNVKSE